MKKIIGAILLISIVGFSCNSGDSAVEASDTRSTPLINYSVVNTQPHDTSYFTEGLEFYKGALVESTGLEGKSKLVQYDLATGKIEKLVNLDPKYFGEGVTIFRDTVYQLTYREGVVHVYDARDFKKFKELPYTNGEGWGLTHDSSFLIGTNGGNSLHYYEPGTFKLVRSISITEDNVPAVNLNEVEFINGFIYANQWQYNTILKIDPSRGEVVAKMDLTSIAQKEKAQNPRAEHLNGIAFNPATSKFYITGKNWSNIYELQFPL